MDLVSRVKGILLSPAKEWAIIDTEPTTVSSLYTTYIIPLAAIPAICGFIGMSIIGFSGFGISFKIPMAAGLQAAVIRFILGLAGTYLLGLIIDAMAPSFGGQKNQIQAFKVAAYSATASWVAGIAMILPSLSFLTILGLYSLYLLYVGLPILMKSPTDKSLGYTIVVVICMIVLAVVMNIIVTSLVPGSVPDLAGLRP